MAIIPAPHFSLVGRGILNFWAWLKRDFLSSATGIHGAAGMIRGMSRSSRLEKDIEELQRGHVNHYFEREVEI